MPYDCNEKFFTQEFLDEIMNRLRPYGAIIRKEEYFIKYKYLVTYDQFDLLFVYISIPRDEHGCAGLYGIHEYEGTKKKIGVDEVWKIIKPPQVKSARKIA